MRLPTFISFQRIKRILGKPVIHLPLATGIFVGLGFLLYELSAVEHPLLPASTSRHAWSVVPGTDEREGTGSRISIQEKQYSLDYSFTLDSNNPYPFAHLGIWFARGKDPASLKNWSNYTHLDLTVRCMPDNVLVFILQTFDEKVSKFGDIESFRPSHALFECGDKWRTVKIDFKKLNTPEWWLQRSNLPITDNAYDLTKVKSFALGNSSQSPRDLVSQVKVAEMSLQGNNLTLFYWGCVLLAIMWIALIYNASRQRTKRLLEEQQEKAKLISLQQSYQPLPSDSKKTQEKRALLQLMTTEFANPELNLETAISRLGMNRTKLNATLKEETGMTFSTCLNHLRLTEAARLLRETDQSVAEIAFRVGYNNASYFNRVFRKAYDCTPGEFKQSNKPLEPPINDSTDAN
ncbi:helix-turn-helix domain-containing protein [Teredinibacter turnerae]|uniref:helix-turn-helix domain-containing protein n=1 Tax=Teredinibacter turnerae TaxID=2426 RepID=UPI0004903C30|nr:AraC family transcriptional regulator [Teredinibacter turnerae]